MRLTIKLIFVLFVLLLASAIFLTHGCGNTLTGQGSGGCPDSTAPADAKIVAPTLGGQPHNAGGDCYPTVGFTVTDSAGNPLNGICVEVFSNGLIALHSGLPNCSNVVANPQTSIVTKTDNSGAVLVELLTLPTTTGGITFVEVASGAVSNSANTPATTQ